MSNRYEVIINEVKPGIFEYLITDRNSANEDGWKKVICKAIHPNQAKTIANALNEKHERAMQAERMVQCDTLCSVDEQISNIIGLSKRTKQHIIEQQQKLVDGTI